MLKDYYTILKPGIIYGNLITASGGYFLAVNSYHINVLSFLSTLIGIGCIIGSGCIVNNFVDRDIDRLMKRTQNRPTVRGTISVGSGLTYSCILAIIGVSVLFFMTNLLTVIVSLVGLFVYTVLYTLWLKRNVVLGTYIGSISGAVPPIVGYCAAKNAFDAGAVILFLILFFWQLPHFMAISIFRLNDYMNASIPVLPATKGIQYTKKMMVFFILMFAVASYLPTLFGLSGLLYFAGALVISLYWLYSCYKGFSTLSDQQWARKMFIISILAIVIICVLMIVDV